MRQRRAALWIVLCGLLVGLAAASPAYAAAKLELSGVRTAPGELSFAANVHGLPEGADLEQAEVSVRVGDEELPAEVSTDEAPQPGAPSPSASVSQVRGVVVAIDASRSMVDDDAIGAARAAAAEYAKVIPADVRLGLVAFAASPKTLVAPTTDRDTFTDALGKITANGDTALYDGVRQSVGVLDDAGLGRAATRRVVVLSDGADTVSKTQLDALAKTLAGERIPVDVVALGAAIDRAALRRISDASDGRYLSASNSGALAGAFREAARSFTARLLVAADVPESLAGKRAVMEVAVDVAGQQLTATMDVAFAAPATNAGAAAPRAIQLPPAPSWLGWALGGIVFLALFVGVSGVLYPVLVGAPRRRRIAQIDWYATGRPPHAATTPDAPGAVARTALAWTERAVRSGRREERMTQKLDRAGMSVRPGEWLLLQICVVFTTVAVLWLLLPWWAGIPLGLLIGCVGMWSYRVIRTKWRIRQFAEQLPDALQLVIGSLRSGFSLAQALSAVVRESADPVAAEIGRALAETRLGAELEDALQRVVSRTDSEDLSWAVMSIRIQREVGGNLAEVLQTAVDTMRERGRLRRHVKALSAEGRLSAYILVALPIGLFGYMFLVRREYIETLYTTGFGIFMLSTAGLLILLGGFWMSRLVKVEV